jgi:hypothetical protein
MWAASEDEDGEAVGMLAVSVDWGETVCGGGDDDVWCTGVPYV